MGSDFIDRIPKARSIKEKRDKLDFIEIKICSGKDVKKMKGKPIDWEKIFVELLSDKGLVFKTYHEFLKHIHKKTKNPI